MRASTPMTIPQLLKRVREDVGITQKQLAELCQDPTIRAKDISRWETGINDIGAKRLDQLAKALNMEWALL